MNAQLASTFSQRSETVDLLSSLVLVSAVQVEDDMLAASSSSGMPNTQVDPMLFNGVAFWFCSRFRLIFKCRACSSCSNWKWIFAILSRPTGTQGIASFAQLAEPAGICIAVSEKILRKAKDQDYDRILERLSQKGSARGVIMFADEDETRFVFLCPHHSYSSPDNSLLQIVR